MSDENTSGDESEGSLLPAALGGAGILVAAALLIFWPSGSESESGEDAASKSASASADGGSKKGRTGGVRARQFDEASGADKAEVRRNPAIRLPQGMGMSPNAPEPAGPPEFETKDQEIDWHVDQLKRAETQLQFRKKAHARLDKIRESIEKGPNPKQGLEEFESRKKMVEDNLQRAEQKVSALKKKLADLGA
jgi:hypothetical protein